MTDTETRAQRANQFCGHCGAPVKSYWNACASCKTALEVRPVGSYEPSTTTDPAPAAPVRAGSSPTQAIPSAWSPEPPPPPLGTSRQWSGNGGASSSDTQTVPAWSAPAAPRSYAPSGYDAGPGYDAPPPYPTAQYSQAPPLYQAPYQRSEPEAKRSSGPWMVIAIVLALLLLGVGAFAGVTASSSSSKNAKLSDQTAVIARARTELATANSKLAALQTQLGSSQTTLDSQSAQIAAFKTCLADLHTFFTDIAETNNVPSAVSRQVNKDCTPLGL